MKGDYRNSHATLEIAQKYENVVYDADSYSSVIWKFERKILDKYLALLKTKNTNLNCLDFACGTGRIIKYLEMRLDYNNCLIGIDISGHMLKIAKSKVSHSQLINADITQNDVISNQTFDLITAFRFFLNAQPLLRENAMLLLKSKLKNNNSILIFNIHGNKYSYRLITVMIFKILGKKLQQLSYWEVENFIEKNDLEVVDSYGIGFVPRFMYRFLPNKVLCHIDNYIQSIPNIKYFGYNLLFVCRKKSLKRG